MVKPSGLMARCVCNRKMNKPLWQPSQEQMEQSNMWLFMHYIKDNYCHDIVDYPSLHKWSIEKPALFWPAVLQFCDVQLSRNWDQVIVPGQEFYNTQWFAGCKLNFAQNLLRYCNIAGFHNKPAIIYRGEDKSSRRISFEQLHTQVARLAKSLRESGIRSGDRVAGFLPNLPETIVAMLATTSIGAIWSSCSPDFGYQGIIDRFGQIEPKILFTADGYTFKGKLIDSLDTVRNITNTIKSIEQTIVVPNIHEQPEISALKNAVIYSDYLGSGPQPELMFEPVPFDHPLYIMYSSGTTGAPKCIVHGTGGTLIQHLKELSLHTDLKPEERIFYFTTCGWMMWNWLVSSLATGATVMLYDGNPFYSSPDVLLDYIDEENINVFGTSAKYLSALENHGVIPAKSHELHSLRCILSTGSPLAPESFDYVYTMIKPDVQLASISGGTDILSCFALGNPLLPVHRGELQCRGLGMDVDVFNDSSQPVTQEKGELVCKSPFPSMPVYFWNDTENRKYKAAYFEKHRANGLAIWAHGDYAELTEHGGLVFHGRADAVLNPGGVRIGTAEIYRQVEKLPEVLESIAVAQNRNNDERIVLFVKLKEGLNLDAKLVDSIKSTIKTNTTPRHVPEVIIQVPDIPRTISGKITELAVRNIIHNLPVNNKDALANPEALEYYKNLDELS